MRTHEVNGHRCEVKKAQTKEQAAGMGRSEQKSEQLLTLTQFLGMCEMPFNVHNVVATYC